ncbi:MAG: ATP synthase F0 subunit A [Proteobacteria bacterium]|nr:ATP synthase F0 subunit A [Pseudomonadota bacterium]
MATGGGEAVQSWYQILLGENFDGLVSFLANSSLLSPETEEARNVATLGANALFGSWTVCFVLLGLALVGRMSLNNALKKDGVSKYHADGGFSVINLFEVYTTFMRDLCATNLPKKEANNFFWLFAGLFLYILFSNLIGVLPGGVPPTQSISNNFAMSIVILVVFVGLGVYHNGTHYFSHMAGKVWWLVPLLFTIELFGALVIRPASLGIRLTGNLNGDHIVLGIVSGFVPYILPVLALCLGVFVSFIQAFVFTLLSMVYITLSVDIGDH